MAHADVVLVGRDKAPTLAGQMVEDALRKQGISTCSFFGDGKPMSASLAEIEEAARAARMTWVGMSLSADLAQPEIAAARAAKEAGKRLAIYADIEGCQNREWFAEFRDTADFLFVLTERERKNTRGVYGTKVSIVVTGNPTHEEFAFPAMSRQEVRSRLNVADDEALILALGKKSIPITCFLVMGILQAIESMNPHKYFIAVFTHPGDEGLRAVVPVKEKGMMRVKPEVLTPELVPYADDEGYVQLKALDPYADIKTYAGDVRVEIIQGTKDFGTPQAIAGADAVVQIAGTEGRRAAYQGIPVIDFFSVVGLNRMKEINKIDTWEPCELGMSYGIYNGDIYELGYYLDQVLTSDGREECAAQQRNACPPIKEKGAAVQAMIDAMRRYL